MTKLRFKFRVGSTLPGRPDLVFERYRVVVFCDGDFWHGRDLARRLAKINTGHNAEYWVAKLKGNVARDATVNTELRRAGWHVVRLWETDLLRDPQAVAEQLATRLRRLRRTAAIDRVRVRTRKKRT